MTLLSFGKSNAPPTGEASGQSRGFSLNFRSKLTILTASLAIVTACSPAVDGDKRRSAVESATGPNAMWYRFTFAADYQGQPFKIDQMVNCTRSVISGGSLGQSPDTVINEAHPMTVAAKMPDGSQVLVRVPDLCSRYRKFDKREGRWGYRAGWKSRGPHSLIPLVIWSDKLPRPDRIESYVARDYYEDPRARIKNPKGSVDLWPAGHHPKNYAAVLDQKDALPFYPNPWINPARDPNGRGKGRDGRYHGEPQRFAAIYIVPVENEAQWVAKYGKIARESSQPVLVPRSDVVLKPTRSDLPVYRIENTDFSGPFAVYRENILTPFYPLDAEPGFVTAGCVNESVGNLMLGKPGMSGLPVDADDGGTAWPDQVLNGLTGLNADINRLDRRILDGMQGRMRNCYGRLGDLLSFDIIDGHLDASRSVPGSIVYHRWYEKRPGPSLDMTKSFLDSGVASGTSLKFRIGEEKLYYPLFGKDGQKSGLFIVEEKFNKKWFLVSMETLLFSGNKENSGF